MAVPMIASRPLGAMFHEDGTASTQTSRTRADAGAAATAHHSARTPADARALTLWARPKARLSDLDRRLHPRVDEAHEVQLLALLGGHLEVDELALLALAGDAGVAGTVHARGRVLADAVLQERELRRRVAVGVCAVGLAELVADLAVAYLRGRLGQVFLGDDGERVRSLGAIPVDDV